jgi:hypothetical protein
MTVILDQAIDSLRALTRGPKGYRSDYSGTISTRDASEIMRFIDAAKPFYDAHAITPSELRYLRQMRELSPAALDELEQFARTLEIKYSSTGASLEGDIDGDDRDRRGWDEFCNRRFGEGCERTALRGYGDAHACDHDTGHDGPCRCKCGVGTRG